MKYALDVVNNNSSILPDTTLILNIKNDDAEPSVCFFFNEFLHSSFSSLRILSIFFFFILR